LVRLTKRGGAFLTGGYVRALSGKEVNSGKDCPSLHRSLQKRPLILGEKGKGGRIILNQVGKVLDRRKFERTLIPFFSLLTTHTRGKKKKGRRDKPTEWEGTDATSSLPRGGGEAQAVHVVIYRKKKKKRGPRGLKGGPFEEFPSVGIIFY